MHIKFLDELKRLYGIVARIWPFIRRYKAIIILALFLVYRIYNLRSEPSKRIAPLSGWGRETPRSIGDYLDPTQNTALIVPRDFCRSKALLTIVVCSFVHHFERRRAIRMLWGNSTDFNYSTFVKLHGHLKGRYLNVLPERLRLYREYLSGEGNSLKASVRIVFILGRRNLASLRENEAVVREAERYNDIIQENFIDSYNNLTIKAVMALKHISQSCVNTTAFYFKCDDDTFVNVPNILHFLLGGTIPVNAFTAGFHYGNTYDVTSWRKRLTARREIMYGRAYCNVAPVANKFNKWYMPSYMFRGGVYPRYLCGSGYLLSIDVVPRLYKASLGTRIVHLEDMFVTGLCAEKAGIKRNGHPLFRSTYPYEADAQCTLKGSFTAHHAKDYIMWEAWYAITNFSGKCPPPKKNFHLKLRSKQKC
ncbi:beta-1,3-galactosyltransferase 1-like isoform X1 [Drosophila santomea]|uniref:beta-1,3-galactosyltransferase 1-like isoform X1 n=2 Tax=Drosophila santomea TaxID=129105 RepID=UPI001954673D|nr:beta-1,3-galactosyltransferase 1-like isoform X1 [Drosophila santomea]